MLDISKVYPFSHENIELLTIDKDLALSWMTISGINTDLRVAALQAYNTGKNRIAEALRSR